MQQPPVIDHEPPSATAKAGWPLRIILPGIASILAFQAVFLPCLCAKGTVKMNIGLAVDLVVVVRVLMARYLKENGRDWIIYLLLAASSVYWIPVIVGD